SESCSQRWPGGRMKLGDVSGCVAREDFVPQVFDEARIPIRARRHDFVALFAQFFVRDVHETEIVPEWRFFTQCSKLRLPAVLNLLLMRDPTLFILCLLTRIFTHPEDHLKPSRHAAKTQS